MSSMASASRKRSVRKTSQVSSFRNRIIEILQDMETHCGLLKNKGKLCSKCTERFSIKNAWVDTTRSAQQLRVIKTKRLGMLAQQHTKKDRRILVLHVKDGMCGHDDDENCTWSVKKTTTVNETCIRSYRVVRGKEGREDCFRNVLRIPLEIRRIRVG